MTETPIRVVATKKYFDKDLDFIRSRLNPRLELVVPERFDDEGILAALAEENILLGPFLSEGLLERAMGIPASKVPWLCLGGALIGAVTALVLQWWNHSLRFWTRQPPSRNTRGPDFSSRT